VSFESVSACSEPWLHQCHSHIRAEQLEQGLIKSRHAQQNHKSIKNLLDCPMYANLLQDLSDEDETERGRSLVQSQEGWQLEMARWILAAQEADKIRREVDSEDEVTSVEPVPTPSSTATPRLIRNHNPKKWQPITLAKLFGKSDKEPLKVRMSRRAIKLEENYMRVMAELETDDDTPDDGAQEIPEEDVYRE
jgi:hypothetical protein